ncbi:hypothetical protein SOVF_002080 isoform B [Spinacia oleracea]|nr:hypothetical protein SOVF_002080 isoform B [Spinacia oleracea]
MKTVMADYSITYRGIQVRDAFEDYGGGRKESRDDA